MIDLTQEELVAIRDVPKHLPPRPTGKRVHISAVYRWLLRGIRGVRLESLKIGGTTYTSKEALQRFADRLTSPAQDLDTIPATTLTRKRQIDRATKQVEAILGRSCKKGGR